MAGVGVPMSVDARLDGREQIVLNVSLILVALTVRVRSPGHAIVIQDMEERLVKKNWTFVKKWKVIPVKMGGHVSQWRKLKGDLFVNAPMDMRVITVRRSKTEVQQPY